MLIRERRNWGAAGEPVRKGRLVQPGAVLRLKPKPKERAAKPKRPKKKVYHISKRLLKEQAEELSDASRALKKKWKAAEKKRKNLTPGSFDILVQKKAARAEAKRGRRAAWLDAHGEDNA